MLGNVLRNFFSVGTPGFEFLFWFLKHLLKCWLSSFPTYSESAFIWLSNKKKMSSVSREAACETTERSTEYFAISSILRARVRTVCAFTHERSYLRTWKLHIRKEEEITYKMSPKTLNLEEVKYFIEAHENAWFLHKKLLKFLRRSQISSGRGVTTVLGAKDFQGFILKIPSLSSYL